MLCWPLLCLCHPFSIFERCLDSNPESCRRKHGRATNLATHLPTTFFRRIFWFFFMYDIQHCFICRPSDSTVSEDAGIEPRTVASTALAVSRSNHSPISHPQTRLYLIHKLGYIFHPPLGYISSNNLATRLPISHPFMLSSYFFGSSSSPVSWDSDNGPSSLYRSLSTLCTAGKRST